ncbi:MAG: DNA-processing protein DprA, partial [Henriciella sp.]
MTAGFGDDERAGWIALARTAKIGPVTFGQLLSRYGSPEEAARAVPSLRLDLDTAKAELDATRRLGGDIFCSCEVAFPKAIQPLDPPPPILSVLGDLSLFERPAVAIVGARDASAAGRKLARMLASGLGAAGIVTVSGLARGIDGEAHAASLDTGTIAVLAGGVDQIYPPQHGDLYREIAERGVIVSERALGHKATARDFPRRNRIITGLAAGTVIVEAAERSGSLISARMAGEQGREVMAVPGSPLDPRASGTNRLLRQGATLVRHAEDVLEAIGPQIHQPDLFARPRTDSAGSQAEPEPLLPELGRRILEALSPTPMPIDEIARQSNCSARQCAAALMELELAGQ